jgi:hypothetical protein
MKSASRFCLPLGQRTGCLSSPARGTPATKPQGEHHDDGHPCRARRRPDRARHAAGRAVAVDALGGRIRDEGRVGRRRPGGISGGVANAPSAVASPPASPPPSPAAPSAGSASSPRAAASPSTGAAASSTSSEVAASALAPSASSARACGAITRTVAARTAAGTSRADIRRHQSRFGPLENAPGPLPGQVLRGAENGPERHADPRRIGPTRGRCRRPDAVDLLLRLGERLAPEGIDVGVPGAHAIRHLGRPPEIEGDARLLQRTDAARVALHLVVAALEVEWLGGGPRPAGRSRGGGISFQ